MIDPQTLNLWLGIISMAISVFASITVFVTSGSKKNANKLDKHESKLTEHDRRVQLLESEIKHLPDRETAHRLELAMEKISGRLDTLTEKLKPIEATNERLNELLIEQANSR